MSQLREAAQQALEALDYCIEHSAEIVAERAKDRGQGSDDLQMMMVEYLEKHRCVIAALRAALEQEPVQEPVAWMYVNRDGECEQIEYEAPPDDPSITPLYTAPPQRKPLTDETLWEMWVESPSDVLRFARAIERAHGITGPEDRSR